MRKTETLFIIFLAIYFFIPNVHARTVSFPGSLQPMPEEIIPNISGNIDWPNVHQEQPMDENNGNATGTIEYPNTPNNSIDSSGSVTNSGNDFGGTTNNQAAPISNDNPHNSVDSPSYSSSHQNQNYSAESNFFEQNETSGSLKNFEFTFPSPNLNEPTQSTNETAVENNNNELNAQNEIPAKSAISQSSYARALALGSVILLLAAFVLWKLKKIPDEVN